MKKRMFRLWPAEHEGREVLRQVEESINTSGIFDYKAVNEMNAFNAPPAVKRVLGIK